MFLEPQEVVELTGATQPAAQERILRELGLNVTRNRLNQVRVAREAVIRMQAGEKVSKAVREPMLRFA